ncbi:hypothetical protein PsorP6_008561 [Peronosclerospora sorghi]|uniref:Uncharacterized protein n=1 Tax=Peronosclerospora sorghi TaxID=230839 RepID=A0ACC0WA93_9STRA|nr:hypothetical protein PsorP6_008561 [Peronosclerospora sorghi]
MKSEQKTSAELWQLMASSTKATFAYVSFMPGASHLQLQLCLHNEQKIFYRPITEKLDRVRYRLALLASVVSPRGGTHKKKRNNGAMSCKQPTISVKFYDANDQLINDKASKVRDGLMRAKRLEIGPETFMVLHNQPLVTELKVLEPVMAGIAINPLLRTNFCTPDECIWKWFRLDKEDERSLGTLVSTDRRYTPAKNEVGHKFYIECYAPASTADLAPDSKVDVVTTPALVGPNRDVFKVRRRMGLITAADKYPNEVDAFRVMSYNVLFDGYATSEHSRKNVFPYVNASVMKESRRIQLILQEIEENHCDIVCLQEIGEHVYKHFLDRILASMGYHGFYSGKTGTMKEGCATFVKTTRFDVVEHSTVDLAAAVKKSKNPSFQKFMHEFPEIYKGISRIPSVAQFLVLRSKIDATRTIILSNTHLFYRGDAHLIRLLQGAAIVERISQHKAVSELKTAAVVMCGDWNAYPQSALISFLLDGQIDSSHNHLQQASSFRWNLSTGDSDINSCARNVTQIHRTCFKHNLRLASACGIPAFTNYVTTFVNTLDYIFVGSEMLRVCDVFPFFTEEEVSSEVALPSSTFPSDHISLVCDLSWKD